MKKFKTSKTTYIIIIFSIICLTVIMGLILNERKEQVVVDESLRIGLSYAEKNNPRLTAVINSFENVSEAKDATLVFHEPKEYTSEWQLEDVKKLLEEELDYLVLSPRKTSIIREVLDAAKEKGVPVILLSAYVSEENEADVVSVIKTDYVKEGVICARILAEKYEGKECRIVEIKGIEGSTIASERAIGFRAEIASHDNMTIVESVRGDFNRLSAKEAMLSVIVSQSVEFDAVFCHSDEDGLGALNAMKVAGYLDDHEVDIVSVNGTQDVLKAIIAGEYLATVQSNAKLGQVVFDVIGQMEREFTPSKMIVMPYAIIDESNAEEQLKLTY